MEPEEELMKLDKSRQQLENLQKDFSDLQIEVQSADRSISLELDIAGRLRRLRLADNVFDRHSVASLERTLLATIQGGQGAAAKAMEKALRGVLPAAPPSRKM